jgi:hypothetical protein
MSNYKYVQGLIDKYKSILSLFNIAGIKSEEIEHKLNSCYYMLGQL